MPRQSEIDAPRVLHHVIIRVIERKTIFKDGKDYRNFLDRPGLILTETETPCFVWTLMSNHAHNPIRTGIVDGIKELKVYPYRGHAILMGKVKKTFQPNRLTEN